MWYAVCERVGNSSVPTVLLCFQGRTIYAYFLANTSISCPRKGYFFFRIDWFPFLHCRYALLVLTMFTFTTHGIIHTTCELRLSVNRLQIKCDSTEALVLYFSITHFLLFAMRKREDVAGRTELHQAS